MSTPSGAVGTLIAIDNLLTLALRVGDKLIPLITGTIGEIRTRRNQQTGELEYEFVLSAGHQNLVAAKDDFKASITLINEERAAAGLPPLPLPE